MLSSLRQFSKSEVAHKDSRVLAAGAVLSAFPFIGEVVDGLLFIS